jgi:RNA 2',3'-cyclic 3'-phosphodiesterase
VRLFVAVWPPAEVLDAIEALDRPARPGVRWTTRDQWHVTLRFLGRVDATEQVLEALAPAASLAAPVAVGGPLTDRLGPSIVMLPVGGLDELAAAVVALTASVGEPPPSRPFAGHLTLARCRDRRVAVGDLAGAALSAAWPVSEVTLVASDLHPSGSRYEVVERFPLACG